MRRIAVALEKGGVGKTTTTVNLGHALAMRGKKVLIIDTDTQGHVSAFLGVPSGPGLAELFNNRGQNAADIPYQARENMWVVRGGAGLQPIGAGLASAANPEDIVRQYLALLEDGYDYVLIDTGPSWSIMAAGVLVYADTVICPVLLEGSSLLSFNDFVDKLKRSWEQYGRPDLGYILPMVYDRRIGSPGKIIKALSKIAADRMCEPMRYCSKIKDSVPHRQTIFEYAPKSKGAQDYAKLAERVMSDG